MKQDIYTFGSVEELKGLRPVYVDFLERDAVIDSKTYSEYLQWKESQEQCDCPNCRGERMRKNQASS